MTDKNWTIEVVYTPAPGVDEDRALEALVDATQEWFANSVTGQTEMLLDDDGEHCGTVEFCEAWEEAPAAPPVPTDDMVKACEAARDTVAHAAALAEGTIQSMLHQARMLASPARNEVLDARSQLDMLLQAIASWRAASDDLGNR